MSHSAACGRGRGKGSATERRWEREPERRTKREEREAEAGIYHVSACSPSLPAAHPHHALPKSYFSIGDALCHFAASSLTPALFFSLCSEAILSVLASLLEAEMDAVRRMHSVKEACLVSV